MHRLNVSLFTSHEVSSAVVEYIRQTVVPQLCSATEVRQFELMRVLPPPAEVGSAGEDGVVFSLLLLVDSVVQAQALIPRLHECFQPLVEQMGEALLYYFTTLEGIEL